ncbi:transposase [Leptospira mayottensis]|uniref:Uncharacterized protein n=2 Tax=Leptospira mayottensis TaxID=1137606 RepID=A0AA87MND3_9LEPT|nr:transposase [Leptospira mayottensis]AXR62968.1 hypothetical protein DQM28_00555 [Leptospira mayottensis]EKS00654.1 hypothetical protein LEP1GSC125_1460 [Leptospira mayottensis 200901122]
MSFLLYQKDQAARFWTGSYESILKYYDINNNIAWDWAPMDSAIVKAPKGELTGKNPTDRAN